MTRWWEGDPSERFWLEITDRQDLGDDLNAPLEREEGGSYWSYDLVREVREGDVVLHYRTRPTGQITAWSQAVGAPFDDEVFWGAHGQAGGRGAVEPYWRPGVRHPLDGAFDLSAPVTKEQLRDLEPAIRAVHRRLRGLHPGQALYFPFQLSDSRPLRAFQGYLTKFPRALVEAIPGLAEVAAAAEPSAANPAPAVGTAVLGADYRRPDPDSRRSQREPFTVDPDAIDRGTRKHDETQNALSDAVREAGLIPRSHEAGEPSFDLAWDDGEEIVVAEVKSLTKRNEERQLRLALGQVQRYAHLLTAKGRPVRAVIAAERKPSDESWLALCDSLGVTLVWPEAFGTLFAPSARE